MQLLRRRTWPNVNRRPGTGVRDDSRGAATRSGARGARRSSSREGTGIERCGTRRSAAVRPVARARRRACGLPLTTARLRRRRTQMPTSIHSTLPRALPALLRLGDAGRRGAALRRANHAGERAASPPCTRDGGIGCKRAAVAAYARSPRADGRRAAAAAYTGVGTRSSPRSRR